MSTICPNCSSTLNISAAQQAKIDQAVARLQPGESIKLKCPKCGGLITVTKPDPDPDESALVVRPPANKKDRAVVAKVQPPPPPPMDWLTGSDAKENKAEDMPMAMLVYSAGQERDSIETTLKNLGYQTFCTEDAEEARERMRFVNFACIVYKAGMHGALHTAPFHKLLCALTMERRRSIFYILVSQKLRTLYDLEALALSANLCVNTKDLSQLPLILNKATRAYEELFASYIEELSSFQGP